MGVHIKAAGTNVLGAGHTLAAGRRKTHRRSAVPGRNGGDHRA